MNERRADQERGAVGSPADRLVTDLRKLDRLDPERPTATERLEAELGADLLGAIYIELDRFDADDWPCDDWRVA